MPATINDPCFPTTHLLAFLRPSTALLTLGSTCKRLRSQTAGRLRPLSLDPFALSTTGGFEAVQRAAHALARLLALVAPGLERLKGPWEHPLYIVALSLALTHRPALSFPKLEAFDVVCTDDDTRAYRTAVKTTAHQAGQVANKATGHPFFLLLTKHAGRFPALSHLRFATEWAGKNGWGLPFVAQPSLLLHLLNASLASH